MAAHTDALALSNPSRCKRVDVVVQQVDGGFQAEAKRRIERQEAHSLALSVGWPQSVVILQQPAHHGDGERRAGLV